MPARWVITPIITFQGAQWPKVGRVTDPGRPPKRQGPETIQPCVTQAVQAIGSENWCLCLVIAQSMANVNADNQIDNVFGVDVADHVAALDQTPRQLGVSDGLVATALTKLSNRGVDITGLGPDATVRQWIAAFRRRLAG